VTTAQPVADLRFGFAPLPAAAPGFYPAADAQALMHPGLASPATHPVPGVLYTGSFAAGQRFVIRVPQTWNGSLVVAGTPATRSEFSSDLIWGEFALARGYAYAASNKGIAVNALLEVASDVTQRRASYPVPFDSGGLLAQGLALRFGMLSPQIVPIDAWNADYRALVVFTRELLAEHHAPPKRVYAVGLSNGGAQVRTLLERHPDLVDGGVEWSAVYWRPEQNVLDELPAFLRELPPYVASGFRDTAGVERLVGLGFPADVRQDDPAHPSLYAEFYSNVPPFYADITLFAYALAIDPLADADYGVPACTPNPSDPARLPATCNGTGLAVPENRAAYVPSAQARAAIGAFAHTGAIGKPLVSIAGTHDVFISPQNHAVAYARAVAQAGSGHLHELVLVDGGTHIDAFAAFGYGLQPQVRFAWAAFDRLVRAVEADAALGAPTRVVRSPDDIG
jgi:alpha-beta hydrolase superfamily lysophospholipase